MGYNPSLTTSGTLFPLMFEVLLRGSYVIIQAVRIVTNISRNTKLSDLRIINTGDPPVNFYCIYFYLTYPFAVT